MKLIFLHRLRRVALGANCPIGELRRRIDSPARIEWNIVALDRPECVRVRTDGRDPSECAAEIADLLALSR